MNGRERLAFARLLESIGSMSASRWDQALRYDVGDESTDAIIAWLAANGVLPYRGESPRQVGLAVGDARLVSEPIWFASTAPVAKKYLRAHLMLDMGSHQIVACGADMHGGCDRAHRSIRICEKCEEIRLIHKKVGR